jgi:uncharacterized protein (DUF983 family)
MKVTRGQIIARGLTNRCANCGGHTLFKPGMHFRINERCADCGLKFDRGDGFFLGPFVINYTVTAICFIVPVILLSAFGVIGRVATFAAVGAGALAIPILLYRRSWSWWLMTYFYFLPHKLPDNRDGLHEDDDE